MALKSQLDNTGIVESKKVLSQTEKQKSFESLKKPQSTKETTKQPVNNAAGAMSKVDEYLNSANVKGYNNLVKSLQNPTNTREEYYKKQEAEQQKRNNDPNNNNFVKSITDFFNKTANTYQQDKETQQKEYDIFSKDTTNVRKENADFIKQQAEAMGISEYDYVKQAKKRANNIDESKSIIDKELSNTKSSLEDNIEITLTNGEKMLGSEHGKKVKEINDSFAQMLSEKEALEAKYKTKGFTTTEAARYNNLIEQMNGLITEAGNYDIQAVGWADFETRGSEIEQQLREKKAALSIAQENGDLAAVSTLTGDIEQLEADKEANKQKLKDQEAYMISQNFDYVMEYGSAIEKEKYAEYISHRNDGLVERLYNMGTAAVIGMAASPFNFADLVLENIDRYNGKDDFDPNNPNLISNQLSDVKNRLNEFSLTGLEGTAGGYILQSVQSILPFVTTILTAKAMGITEGIDTISTLAQGFQVGAETAKQDIANGGDLATAELHGLLMGAISTLTEKIGGEGFINMISGNAVAGLLGDGVLQSVNWLDVIRIINRSSLAEGVEEVMEDLGDRAANSFINYLTGKASNLQNTSYDDFSQLGNGNELLNYGADLTNSFIMAYIGSVILGAGTTVPGAIQNNAVYNYVTGDMAIQTQEQFDLAQHLKEQLLQGIEFNDNELVELQNKNGSKDLIAAKQNDTEGAREAIRALDAMMVRYTENSKTYGRVILLNNKSNIPTVEQSYGSLLEATKSDIIETIDITNELATNTAIANKLTEQVLEQRNINVSVNEWANYSKSAQDSIAFTSRSLQKLGIKDFSIEALADDTNGLNVNINGKNIIKLNANGNAVDIFTGKELSTAETVKRVAIHELWHRVENTEAGKQLKELLDKEKGMSKVLSVLENNNIEDIDNEKYAYMLENTLDSEAFISQLVERKGSALKAIIGDLKALFSNGYGKYFNDVLQKYEAALEEYENNPLISAEESYSKKLSADGLTYVEIEQDILKGVPKDEWINTVKNNLKEKFNKAINFKGLPVYVDKQSRNEMTYSKYTKWLLKTNEQMYADKLKSTNNIDEILEVAYGWMQEDLKHKRKDKIYQFERGRVLLKIGDNAYSASVIVGDIKSGEYIVYDIISLKPTTIKEATMGASDSIITDGQKKVPELPLGNSINENNKTGNKKYSKKLNSNGEQLTEDQVEHFANSAIVDKNGNLKVMYTGSPNKFTKFDKSKARKSGLYGSGFYFTESKSAASTYGNVMEVYLNITNPVDVNNETRTITDKQLRKFVTELAENEDYGIENYGYGATVDSIVKSLKGKSDFALLQDLNATCVGDMVEAVELFNKVNGTNYDGIIAKTETVAFYPNQIKNTDNLNPTSNDDIRYSKKLNADYIEAATNGKTKAAQKMVYDYANETLDTVVRDIKGKLKRLYHGTRGFGFTSFNTDTIYLTDSINTASTYSGNNNVTSIADSSKADERIAEIQEALDQKNAIINNENTTLGEANKLLRKVARYRNDSNIRMYYADSPTFRYAGEFTPGYFISGWQSQNEPFATPSEALRAAGWRLYTDEESKLMQGELRPDPSGNYSVAAIMKNPIIVNGNGDYWNDLTVFAKDNNGKTVRFNNEYGDYDDDSRIATRDWEEFARDNGYDGVIFNNIIDNGGFADANTDAMGGETTSNVYAVFGSNNVKSLDAITYDDNGNIIPLNERFDDTNSDIRYSKKLTPLSDIDQEVKDNMLYKLAVNESSFNDAFVRNFGKVLQQYKDATTEEAKAEARSAIEQYREQIKEIVGEKYDLGNGYSFTGRDLKRAMRAKTLDWNSIKKDLPASPAELKKARAELQKYYTIRNTGGVSADVLIDEINSEFGLDIESNGKDALYDLIAIHKDVDEKNAANTVYSGMDQLETNYGFAEEEWDKRFDDMVESYGLVTLGGVKNDVFAKFDDYLSKFGEANDPYANEAKDAKKWVQAVQKAEENTNAVRNVEQTKQNFIENADKWIPNYKVLAEKYSVVSKETLGKALYEILIEGQLSEESYSKLAEDFSSDIYANKTLINQIKDFQDDAVKYFAVDAALKEDRKNIGKAVTRAMNVGKSYGSAGANFEQNYIEQKGIVESIEKAEKNRKMLRDKYSPIAKTMIEAADDVATAVLSHKTLSQVLDKVWGLKNGVRTELRDTIEARKNVAQREMTELHRNYADELEEIIKDTGIKGGSKESRLAQFIREGHTNEIINGEYVPYTLEQLKKDADYKMANGKMAWENILEASERLGNAFDRLILLINITQEDIYGDAVGEKEYELAQLGVKVRLESKGMLDLMDQMKKAPTPELQLALNRAETNLNRYVNEYNALADKLQTKDAARRQFTPFRSNYVHHIVPNTFKGKLKSILRENSVPTSLVGENNASPNTAWAGFMAAQGKGEYMPDIVESFASYIRDASRVIAYNPYVYEMRQLENEIKSLDKHDRLNDFTEWWDIYLNDIAGKKNTLDKGITQMIFDNKAMNVAKLMVNQAKSATLMFNAHSALVQIANIPNGLSILNQEKDGLQSFGKGLARYLSAVGNKNSELSNAMDQSGFLAERFMDVNTQNVTLKSKINDTASWLMTIGDKMGTQIIWSAAYEQGKARNLSGIKLTEYADDITRRAVAGRGIGEVPLALKSNIFNMLVPFQVETNNQWQTLKSQLSNKQYGAVATSMVAAFLFNGIFQLLGAGDVLSEWITPFFNEIKKYRKDKEEDNEMTVGDLLVNIAVGELGETLSMIPGASMIVNMFLNKDDSDNLLGEYSPSRYGTTQLGAKGIGDIVKGVYNTTTDLTSGEYYQALRDAVSTGSVAIKNFAPGGTQLVRTTEGLQSMGALPQLTANGLEVTPVNYTNSGKVRYINDQSNITDWIKASLFGKWQTSAAQDYIDSGFKTVSSSTMNMYNAIEDSVGNPKQALDISKEIMGITSIKDEEGKTINNSRALQVRKELEEQGLYDEVLEAINSGVDPSKFNLNKTVIGYDNAAFNKAYNSVVGGNRTQAVSQNKAATKANKEETMNDTKKATVADYIAKNGLGNNSKKTASSNEKLTKKEQSIVEYIAKVSNYNGSSSQKSIETTIANLLKKLGNSTADVQRNIAAMQKKTKNL